MDGAELFRAFLVRVAANHHLHANVHHAVFGGWPAAVYQRELWALYAAFSRGEAPHLPERTPTTTGSAGGWVTTR